MSGFAINWLNLREAADLRARDGELLSRACQWLKDSDKDPVVVDIGAGTGSTLRAFTETEIAANRSLTWRLVDHDASLLAEARRRYGESHTLETLELDLTKLDELPLQGARLVTASALFDLVSSAFIADLVNLLVAQNEGQPIGLYAALTYNGATRWEPPHPLDRQVLAALNHDQRRDKGFGPALGPDAANAMQQQFEQAGFRVWAADSDWVLGEADIELTGEFIAGIGRALADHALVDSQELQEWVLFRHSNLESGSCVVGHTDLLVLPGA